MTALTKSQKSEVDQVVMLAIERLHERRFELNTIYWDQPSRFARILILKMGATPTLSDMGEVLRSVDVLEAISLVVKSIRRLRGRKKLRIQYITVPVMSTRTNKMSNRKIACYWPTTVLDALANV